MAAPLDVRKQDGTVSGTVVLDEQVFGVQPNVPVMHQVVVAQLAAARAGTQSTKTRAEVSGGGAKPFKQKGTGRARQGSIRAPHYSGGGIALGPKPRKYRQRTPRKMVQLALRGALSDRANEGRVLVVDTWDWPVPNTKSAREALATLGVSGKAMVVLSRDDELAYKSFRNLPEVDLVLSGELAAYDVLCSDWVIFTRATVPGDSVWGDSAPAADEAKPTARPRVAKAAAEVATAAAEEPEAAAPAEQAVGTSPAEEPQGAGPAAAGTEPEEDA